jgi:methionyl-tRNA formyltransferase
MSSSEPSGSNAAARAARPRAVFFGSPAFAVPALARVLAATEVLAVVTQPDRPAGRGQALTASAVKQAIAARAPTVPVLQPEKIRTPELEAQLRALAPDLFIVVAYGRILPPALLELPRLGPWNVHASLLPRLRGAAPIQWAIINGDAQAGVSIMRMEAGLDTGPVVARAATDVHDDDTAATLAARLATLGAELLVATLPGIVDGTARPVAQDDAGATLAPILKKEDGRLDFTRPARVVSARARGVEPWPGATASLDGAPVKLFGPRVLAAHATSEVAASPPGTVLRIDDVGLAVACADGAVVFAEVQLPGRKRLPAAAVAAGRAIAVGARFA